VAQGIAAVGQQYGKIAEHHTRIVAVPAGLGAACPPRQRAGQPEPVGQFHQ
jgi:hypothetical protein